MKRILINFMIIGLVSTTGCSMLGQGVPDASVAKDKPAKTGAQAKKSGKLKKKKSASKKSKSELDKQAQQDKSATLDSELLYQLMSAEIAGQRGDLDVAVQNYLAAAETSQDPEIAERATRIAVYARDEESGLRAARIWLKHEPGNLDAHQVIAALLVRKGQLKEALEHLDFLVKSRQSGTNGFMLISSLLSKEKDKQAALQAMQQLVHRYRNNPQALYALSHLAYVGRNLEIAEQSIVKALQLDPDWSEAVILYANILGRMEKHQLATQKLEAFLAKKPGDKNIRMFLARKYIDLKQYKKSRGQFEILLKQDPENVDALYALGLIAMQLRQSEQAKNYFSQLLKLGQRKNESFYYLGQIAEAEKNTREAKRRYGQLEEGNYYLEANIHIANIIAREGDIQAAREHLQNIPADNAEMELKLYLAEGEILREARQFQQAVQLYSDGLEQLPDNVELLYARALTAEKLDNIEQTINDLTRITKVDPGNVQALNALGYTLVDQSDRIKEGFEYIRKAYAANPEDPAIMDSMGWAYYRTGDYKTALKFLRKAFERFKDAEIAAHLGEVLWVMGDEKQARQIWKDALQQKPENETLLNVIKRFSK